ncbi:MAG: cytochrome-c peroxidase [Flavobacteriales bacterium]|nr:cytochrome-c peroxidase [Flavobacteriales bacterium]
MKRLLFLFIVVVFIGACRKDEKISVAETTPYTFDLPQGIDEYEGLMPIPADNPMTEEGVELGRLLFFDERLSANNTQSCASCHIPEYSFSDTTAVSIGIDGIAGDRNAMPIINLGWAADGLFWDGRSATMEEQAFGPVVNPVEMHDTWPNVAEKLQADPQYPTLFEQVFGSSQIDSVMVSKAISQFERTLISGNSPFDKYLNGGIGASGWSAAEELKAIQGFAIFMDENKGDCFHCHGSSFEPLFTDNLYHNNGLDASFTDKGLGAVTGNPSDDGKFKTPTLRNLAFTGPYMHDGRFETLGEVVDHYSFGLVNSPTIDPLMKGLPDGGVNLTPVEKDLLITFLLSLSDSSFVTNPAFQDPE